VAMQVPVWANKGLISSAASLYFLAMGAFGLGWGDSTKPGQWSE